jgi:hypothetical protein
MANIESVILQLEAKVGKYNADVQGAASVTDKALARIETSATRMEKQVGQSFAAAAQRSRLLGYQISDIGVQLSGGTSPFIVLAQQGPQVANALEGARGAVGRFATFLSGPYGAAILAATTLLGAWLTKNKDAGESVQDLIERLKEKTRQEEISQQATEAYNRTIDGHIKKQRELTKVLDDQLKTQRELNHERLTAAMTSASTLEIDARALESQLAKAEAAAKKARELALHPPIGTDPNGLAILVQNAARAEEAVKRLQSQLANVRQQAEDAQTSIRQAQIPILDDAAEATADKATAAIQRQEDALASLRKEYIAGRIAEADYIKQKAELTKQLKAAKEAAQDEKKATRSSNSSAANIGDMTALIRQLFPQARITSTTSGKHTKGSDHYAGRAIDFVVPGMMNEAGTIMVRQILQAAGVEIRRNASGREQFFGPGRGASSPNDHADHFHVAWSGRASPETAQRAADAEERRRQSFENELASLLSDEIAAKRALTETAEDQAKLRLEDIETERKAYNDNLDSLVAQRKLRADEAEALRAINDETAKYKAELVKRNEEIRKFRMDEAQRQRDEQYASATRADQAEILQGQADLARTLDERNEIERHLVDLKYQEEKAANDAAIAAAERAQIEFDANRLSQEALDNAKQRARIAQVGNDSIDQRKGADLESINRNNPLGRYIDDISDTKKRVEEATVRELQAVNDGITDALTKQLGIKNRFVKDLFSIFLDQVIFKPLAEALNKGGAGGGSPIGTFFSSIFGSIFGRASGGYAAPGSIHRVNEHAGGVELLRMGPQGGTVIPLGQVNQRATQASQTTVVQPIIQVDARGAVMNDQFARQILAQADQRAVAIAGQMGHATLKAMPARMASYQRDGT